MTITKNPNATSVQTRSKTIEPGYALKYVHETRETFFALIEQVYPQLRQVKFKRKNYYHAREYFIRSQYGKRQLFWHAPTVEEAIIGFFAEINKKVYQSN
jgi:hypothetical protein